MKGVVKWFSREKGYGFITSEDGEDHYFNVQSVRGVDLPSIGDKVGYDSKLGSKGPRALNVHIVEKAAKENNRAADDRISCPGCGKKIVPRIITYRGEPQQSVCPYCAATVKTFAGDCFIATAVYGDPWCPEVRALRRFRDEKLLPSPVGKWFVGAYYKISPSIAEWLKSKPWLSGKIRMLLSLAVQRMTIR